MNLNKYPIQDIDKTCEFSAWNKWKLRNELEEIIHPGVYCLIVADSDLTDKPYKLDCNICYYGKTTTSFKSRLNAFNSTIKYPDKNPKHGGADRFNCKYYNDENIFNKLYVSICAIKPHFVNDGNKKMDPEYYITNGIIGYYELKCISDYLKKYNKLPKFNNHESGKYSKKNYLNQKC